MDWKRGEGERGERSRMDIDMVLGLGLEEEVRFSLSVYCGRRGGLVFVFDFVDEVKNDGRDMVWLY